MFYVLFPALAEMINQREKMPKRQLSIRLGPPLERAMDATVGSKSRRVNDLAARYWWIVDASRPDLSEAEWSLLIAVGAELNLSPPEQALPQLPFAIEDAVHEVGASELAGKLRAMSRAELVHIAERIEAENA